MHENENGVPERVPGDAPEVETPSEPDVEEQEAQEFAEEMKAEPHNIDGGPGEASAEEIGHGRPTSSAEPNDIRLAGCQPAPQIDESVEPEPAAAAAEEREVGDFAEQMQAEPGEATAEDLAGAEASGHGRPTSSAEPNDIRLAGCQPAPQIDESVEPEPAAAAAEEHEAEEFAEQMQAEPQNIDGEPGEATAEELAGAEASGHVDSGSGESSPDALSAEEILAPDEGKQQTMWPSEDAEITAMLEAVIYITDEPLTLDQIASALEQPRDRIKRLLDELVAEWQKPHHGLAIREVAGGYKMATKAEHHDAVRQFVKNLKPPMKLSLPALETLAVIAYKQPATAPEIMEIRGVQGAGVLKTLIDRKLVAPAGRKNVIGKPILYKTTKEFLVQFGLKDLSELPSVKEFEELARFATSEPEISPAPPPAETAPLAQPPVETPAEEAQAPEPEGDSPPENPSTE